MYGDGTLRTRLPYRQVTDVEMAHRVAHPGVDDADICFNAGSRQNACADYDDWECFHASFWPLAFKMAIPKTWLIRDGQLMG